MLHPALQLIETDGRGTEHVSATRTGHTQEAVYINQHFFLPTNNKQCQSYDTYDTKGHFSKKGHISHKAVRKYAKAGSGKDQAL